MSAKLRSQEQKGNVEPFDSKWKILKLLPSFIVGVEYNSLLMQLKTLLVLLPLRLDFFYSGPSVLECNQAEMKFFPSS